MLSPSAIERRLDLSESMLDQHYPGWHKIDPATVDIEFCNTCILGRYAGDFNDEFAKSKARGIQPEEFLGIFAGDIPDGPRRKAVYTQLTEGMRCRMRGRQAREGRIAGLLPAPATIAA